MRRLFITLLIASPLFCYASSENKEKNETPESSSATVLTGTVGNVRNYQPLSDVQLTLQSTTSDVHKTINTDEQGKFRVEGLPAGSYSVSFSKDGFETGSYPNLILKKGVTSRFGFTLFED